MKISEEHLNAGSVLLTVESNIKSVFMLKPVDLTQTKIGLLHYMVVSTIYSILLYTSFLIKKIIELRIASLAASLVFPVFPIIGCFFIILTSFIIGRIYGLFLNEHSLKNYYLVLLSFGYLSIVILISSILGDLSGIFYICAGIASDYFLRESLVKGKEWTSQKDEYYFITISMVMNIGLYWAILPLFFQ
ncbi:hypothetical protein NUSPORA_01305 [Nucleospora cyclopteri]